MNKSIQKNPRKKNPYKKQGATLISVILLSILVMSLLLGAARTIGEKIEVSADFFFGEKAYFAAESGVEKALLVLKDTPIKHGNIPISMEDGLSEIELFIKNKASLFSFQLNPFESRKLRLKKNTQKDLYEAVDLESLKLTAKTTEPTGILDLFVWSIQCSKEKNEIQSTLSIQEKSSEINEKRIIEFTGKYDDTSGLTRPLFPVSSFWNEELESDVERQSCFLSLQNLTESEINIEIKGTEMAPEKAIITARGISKNREKNIQFEYLQNNLSSFFNFGLLHTDKE